MLPRKPAATTATLTSLVAAAVLLQAWMILRTAAPSPSPSPVLAAPVRPATEPCVAHASLIHDVHWAAACMRVATQENERHAACLRDWDIMDDPARGRAFCDRTYGGADGSPDCTLPSDSAARLNAMLREMEQRCEAGGRI